MELGTMVGLGAIAGARTALGTARFVCNEQKKVDNKIGLDF